MLPEDECCSSQTAGLPFCKARYPGERMHPWMVFNPEHPRTPDAIAAAVQLCKKLESVKHRQQTAKGAFGAGKAVRLESMKHRKSNLPRSGKEVFICSSFPSSSP